MITYNKENLTNKLNMAKALQSPTVIQACISTIKREYDKMGVTNIDTKLRFSIENNYIYVSAHNTASYDAIMKNKNTSILDLKTIFCIYRITQKLVDYNCELSIVFTFSCDLPEDDLLTLRMLGKVHTEYHTDSYTSESIYCEV